MIRDESKEEDLEFEPLFDYSRVQPLNFVSLDDDSSDLDETLLLSSKRLKKSHLASCGDDKPVEVVKPVVCDINDDQDWLRSPPKTINAPRKIEEDPTLKELRLKKQELASCAQSAESLLRAVEESAKKHYASSVKSYLESESETISKPLDDREKIVISIQDKEGLKQFRVFKEEKLERIFKLYADKVKHDLGNLVFSFDGDKVIATASPETLGMEDEDIIEVHSKAS